MTEPTVENPVGSTYGVPSSVQPQAVIQCSNPECRQHFNRQVLKRPENAGCCPHCKVKIDDV